jgi:hypothetical protein
MKMTDDQEKLLEDALGTVKVRLKNFYNWFFIIGSHFPLTGCKIIRFFPLAGLYNYYGYLVIKFVLFRAF